MNKITSEISQMTKKGYSFLFGRMYIWKLLLSIAVFFVWQNQEIQLQFTMAVKLHFMVLTHGVLVTDLLEMLSFLA